MTRLSFRILVGLQGALLAGLAAAAAPPHEPREAAQTSRVTYDHLTQLGDAVSKSVAYKDNGFTYEERSRQLSQWAKTLEGATLDFAATVSRVTHSEVYIHLDNAGKTRVVLRHPSPPHFSNLASRWYDGPPSAEHFNLLAGPTALRIGSEISLDVARQLRKGDLLRLAGRVDTMLVKTESVFNPRSIAIISDWQILDTADASRSDLTR